jgi:hypothetical protein
LEEHADSIFSVLQFGISEYFVTSQKMLNLYDRMVCGIFGSTLLLVEIVYCQSIFGGGEMEYVQSLDHINV